MPRTKAKATNRYLSIPFGSQAHADLLGIDAQDDPDAKAKLVRALNTVPIPMATNKTDDDEHQGTIPWLTIRGEVLSGGWRRMEK